MITIEKIQKRYGNNIVLSIDQLEIKAGECFGLVGNNGAGKTTLFSLILDLIKPTNGEVSSKSVNVAASEEWKNYTGSYLDEGFLIDFLTPDEYFNFIGKIHGLNRVDLNNFLDQYREFFNDEIIGKKKYLRDLSKGNQKKVGLIASLIGNPEVLILDEPFANLDPSSQIRLKRLINDLPDHMTIIISSHDLNHVTEVCDRIVVLDKGEVVKDLHRSEETLKELETYFTV